MQCSCRFGMGLSCLDCWVYQYLRSGLGEYHTFFFKLRRVDKVNVDNKTTPRAYTYEHRTPKNFSRKRNSAPPIGSSARRYALRIHRNHCDTATVGEQRKRASPQFACPNAYNQTATRCFSRMHIGLKKTQKKE